MKNIAIFASGNGSNAQNLIKFFNFGENGGKDSKNCASVKIIICNKPDAYVLTRAKNLNIPHVVLKKEELTTSPQKLLQLLKEQRTDYIVLAGYLLKIPAELIQEYPGRIINIHPALLPAYGGKGMYGRHVHEAVIAAKEKESGITIHLVDTNYDSGKILLQARCSVDPEDTPDTLADKIHQLEHNNFPPTVAKYIKEG
ncbi:MAG: phosphoribosylglycinamide formyltransferase [Bacteroidales bacterium]|nr:phosphoribosylglycinamide formyltransferase [Bacteroidales bacterium]